MIQSNCCKYSSWLIGKKSWVKSSKHKPLTTQNTHFSKKYAMGFRNSLKKRWAIQIFQTVLFKTAANIVLHYTFFLLTKIKAQVKLSKYLIIFLPSFKSPCVVDLDILLLRWKKVGFPSSRRGKGKPQMKWLPRLKKNRVKLSASVSHTVFINVFLSLFTLLGCQKFKLNKSCNLGKWWKAPRLFCVFFWQWKRQHLNMLLKEYHDPLN